MYVYQVIPLTRLPLTHSQLLDYFSAERLPRGALVRIRLGNSQLNAIVVRGRSASAARGQLRKTNLHSLRQVSAVICAHSLLSDQQLKLAQFLHEQCLAPLGACLKMFLPANLATRKTTCKFEPILSRPTKPPTRAGGSSLVYGPQRTSAYLSKIKSAAREHAVCLLLVPDLEQLAFWQEHLKQQAPELAVTSYHSGLPASALRKIWQQVRHNELGLVLGTRAALFLPYQQLDLLIVDQEDDQAYGPSDQQPRYSVLPVARQLASLYNSALVLGGNLPSLSAILEAQDSCPQLPAVNCKLTHAALGPGALTRGLPGELAKIVRGQLVVKRKTLIFLNRKGTASLVLCAECGHQLQCPNCVRKLAYCRQLNRAAQLVCYSCGYVSTVPSACPQCQSHRLISWGWGTHGLSAQFLGALPEVALLQLDKDATPTREAQLQVLTAWLSNPKAVLVCTELINQFAARLFAHKNQISSIIIKPELMQPGPDFNANERAFRVLYKLATFSSELLILSAQTDNELLSWLSRPASQFLQQELAQRAQFNLPPHSQLIELYFAQRTETGALKLAEQFRAALDKNPQLGYTAAFGPLPAWPARSRGLYQYQLIIKCADNCTQLKRQLAALLPIKAAARVIF